MSENFANTPAQPPYETLGDQLKNMRERQSESLAEVSGAVEIEVDDLERIEAGHERPSEDILLLLINHFNVQDQEAVQLWELAGYEEPPIDQDTSWRGQTNRQPTLMIVGIDVRTMYSDSAQFIANQAGIVAQFSQLSVDGQTNIPVARVGMSYEQAEQVLKQLQQSLLKAKYDRGPRRLTDGK